MDKQDLKDLIAILANVTQVLSDLDKRLKTLEEKNAVKEG
jgi:hypothetical protein